MTVEFGLENRVILITGGGAVGTATGVEAARIGAKVALFEFSEEALARSTAAIEEAGGTVRGYTVDVRDSDALDSAIDKATSS